MTGDRSDDPERLYRRLVISHWDLQEAEFFARDLVKLSLRLEPAADETKARALTLAAVVSYTRPFKKSLGTMAVPSLRIESMRLTEAQSALHHRLLRMRDTAFAHADEAAIDLRIRCVPPFTRLPVLRDARVPLDCAEAHQLLELILTVSSQVSTLLIAYADQPIPPSSRSG